MAVSSPNCSSRPCAAAAAWYSPSRSPNVGSGVFATKALMPILAIKSMPRGVPLTSGCQMATGRRSGRGTRVSVSNLVASVGHARREVIIRAVVGKRFLVEGLEQDFDLFLEQGTVSVCIEHRGAKGLDFAGMVAAPYAEDHPALGQDVGHREVLGQPQRMPHGGDVEATSKFQPRRLGGQVHIEHQQIRDAFIAFRLEVMLRHPELVIAQRVQQLGEVHGPFESLGELVVGIPAVVCRGPLETEVVINNVTRVRRAKTAQHERPPVMATMWCAQQSPAVAWMLQVSLLVVKSRSLHGARHGWRVPHAIPWRGRRMSLGSCSQCGDTALSEAPKPLF